MKIRIGVVLRFEHADKLARILALDGVEVPEYCPVFEVPWQDGTVSRHDTFEEAVAAYAQNATWIARTSPPPAPEQP